MKQNKTRKMKTKTEQQDLLLMLVATLIKRQRKKTNALNLLSDKILSADKDQLKILEKEVRGLFE